MEWTEETNTEAVRILSEKVPDSMKDRRYYHVRKTFELVELGGVRRVRRIRDQKLMATIESFSTIVKDVHVSIGHKGETKTYKKLQQKYSNIPLTVVRQFITKCERCAEKRKKKSVRGVVVRPITVSAPNRFSEFG